MTFIDAYGLVALVADEPAAAEVEELLRAGGSRVVAVNLAEAIDLCGRTRGFALDEVRRALEPLILSDALTVVVSDEQEAWFAAELRGKHYHRRSRPISMADSLLLAHVLSSERAVATADPDVAAVARSEGSAVIALPDRSGKRP